MWNMNAREYIRTLTGHISSVESLAINEELISGSGDLTNKVWDIK